MNLLVRNMRCEFIKMKRTPLLLLHLIVPIVGAIGFLGLLQAYNYSDNPYDVVILYFQLLSIAFPFLIGLITNITCNQESEVKCVYLLSSYDSFTRLFFMKVFFFLCLSALSVGIATIAGALCLQSQNIVAGVQVGTWLKMGVVLCVSNGLLYIIHMFISLKVNGTISIVVGLFGSLLSAVLATGLGDGVWQFVPYAWGIKFSEYAIALSIYPTWREKVLAEITTSIFTVVIVGIIISIMVLLWSRKWEGQRGSE